MAQLDQDFIVILTESMAMRKLIACSECNNQNRYPFGRTRQDTARYAISSGDTLCEIHALQCRVQSVENVTISKFMSSNEFRCMYEGCPTRGNFNQIRYHEEHGDCKKMPQGSAAAIAAYNPRNGVSFRSSVLESLRCGACTAIFGGDTFIDIATGISYCGTCPGSQAARIQGHRNLMFDELVSEVTFHCSICDSNPALGDIAAHGLDSCFKRKLLSPSSTEDGQGPPILPQTA